MGASPSTAARPTRGGLKRLLPLVVLLVLAAVVLAPAAAFAGQASSGQPFFYPCISCHPVNMVAGPGGTEHPSKPLPNGMQGHKIVLEAHDKLGSA
ncbi:MAG TPA: hypothetical protein VIL06_06015, partial [Coriobacteriia bacterium]